MAAFVWGGGGERLTPEQIAAREKIAQAMMLQAGDTSPIQHWTQGADRVLKGLLGGYDARQAADATKANAAESEAQIAAMLAGSPAAVATPVAVPVASTGGNPDRAAIAGIESGGRYDALGPVTKIGDRAYGKYQVMGANIPAWSEAHLGQRLTPQEFLANRDAQDKIFDAQFGQYKQKYGAEGAAKAWFAGEGGMNNPNARDQLGTTVSAYADKFTKALGPVEDPAALPANATPTQGYVIPGQPSSAVANVAGAMGGVNPTALKVLTSPYSSPGAKKIAELMVQQQMQGNAVTTVDLGNSVGIMDKRGNLVRQIPKGEPNKGPTHGVIGEDALGNKQYGWVDPRDRSVVPVPVPGGAPSGTPLTVTGPGGVPIEIPAGVNPKKFRDDVTSAAADAAVGKKTEVQASSESFANRMEGAEKAVKGLEGQGANLLGKAADSWTPYTGGLTNYLKSEDYQKYSQAKSQFITALLRRESGAAISPAEFERYDREFFPQPGEGEALIKQKREARHIAIEGMKKGAGPGYKPPASAPPAPRKTKTGVTWDIE